MDKWIKDNKLTAIIFVVIAIGVVFFFVFKKQEPVVVLGDYSLPSYGQYNSETAKNLILLPLKAVIDPSNEVNDNNQRLGYGLLGASLLDTGDEYPMLGYRSFFLGGSDIVGFYGVTSKMEASFLHQENILLIEPDLSIVPTGSIIRKREAAIYAIVFGLDDRYTYKDTHEMVYDRDHILRSNKLLANVLREANQVFDGLKDKGYDDLTLKYAIGILHASLRDDGVDTGNINRYKFGTSQIYTDALKSTLRKYPLAPTKNEGTFLRILISEMSNRDLNMLDLAFFKKQDQTDDTPALIKIIEEDLDKISK